jgi:uncharacterized protein
MLVEGRGVACDLKAARAWFIRAADSGMSVSTAAALGLFEKAAAKGHAGAMFALGALHAGGHGMPTNRAARGMRAAG